MFNGEYLTTFKKDFTIADRFGLNAIKDTFRNAFDWRDNYKYLTELVIVLNHKIWEHYENGNEKYAELYNELWEKADRYACNYLEGKEAEYFFEMTD